MNRLRKFVRALIITSIDTPDLTIGNINGVSTLGAYRFVNFEIFIGGTGWYSLKQDLIQETISILNEEYLHWILHKLFDRKTSMELDKLTHDGKTKNWIL